MMGMATVPTEEEVARRSCLNAIERAAYELARELEEGERRYGRLFEQVLFTRDVKQLPDLRWQWLLQLMVNK